MKLITRKPLIHIHMLYISTRAESLRLGAECNAHGSAGKSKSVADGQQADCDLTVISSQRPARKTSRILCAKLSSDIILKRRHSKAKFGSQLIWMIYISFIFSSTFLFFLVCNKIMFQLKYRNFRNIYIYIYISVNWLDAMESKEKFFSIFQMLCMVWDLIKVWWVQRGT